MADIDIRLPAAPDAVPRARCDVVRLAKELGGADRAGDVKVAVTEALANAVVHAYPPPDDPGEIEVRAGGDPGGPFRVEVSDAGRGTMENDPTAGLGLGLPLMRTFADELEIDSGPQGTTVVLTFHLRAREAAARVGA